MEIHNIVQEVVSKTNLKKKKCRKAKWLSEEILQIAEKRREAKGKRVKERYIHLNAEFQRITRRDKKAFLCEQCKEIEENNRMGKTRSITTNKANGGNEIPAEPFQIRKMVLLKCHTQYAIKFGKLSSGHRTGKVQFSFQSQRRAMPKNVQTTTQLYSFHMLAKQCSKSPS